MERGSIRRCRVPRLPSSTVEAGIASCDRGPRQPDPKKNGKLPARNQNDDFIKSSSLTSNIIELLDNMWILNSDPFKLVLASDPSLPSLKQRLEYSLCIRSTGRRADHQRINQHQLHQNTRARPSLRIMGRGASLQYSLEDGRPLARVDPRSVIRCFYCCKGRTSRNVAPTLMKLGP